MKKTTGLLFFVLIVCLPAAQADEQSSVIISKQDVSLTTEEVNQFLLTIPEQDREMFAGNPQRLIEAIDSLIINKVAYQDALRSGVAQQPEVKAKLEQTQRRIVIEAWLEKYVDQQPEADYAALAQEKYILNKAQYTSPATVDVKHILITTGQRSAAEAHAKAEQLLQDLKRNEADFDKLAAEHSEDPTYPDNQGLITGIRQGATAPAFEQAAFALTEAAPLSEVVDTQFGSHILYLAARHPARELTFAEVEQSLIDEARQKQKSRIMGNYLDKIKQQEVTVNEAVLNDFLERHRSEQQVDPGN